MTNQTEPNLASVALKRIRRAKKILGPGCREKSVEATVWYLLVRAERNARGANKVMLRVPTNKQEKAAVDRVARDLRRLNVALKNPDLPKLAFPRELKPTLNELQENLEHLALRRLGRPHPSRWLQQLTVAQAAALLQEHQHP